jgi:DnaK suppressor protein
MNKVFLEKMKQILLTQRQEILNKSNPDPSMTVVDMEGDETDIIQGNMLIELSKQLATRDVTKLNSIDSALERIENSTYGVCEDCGEDIVEKRLLHNPYFLTCVSCAEDREVDVKQRKRS